MRTIIREVRSINESMIFQIIASMLENDATVEMEGFHTQKRMKERHITATDVFAALSKPQYIKKESVSESFADRINYRIVGYNEVSVVAWIDYPNKIVVVTVID